VTGTGGYQLASWKGGGTWSICAVRITGWDEILGFGGLLKELKSIDSEVFSPKPKLREDENVFRDELAPCKFAPQCSENRLWPKGGAGAPCSRIVSGREIHPIESGGWAGRDKQGRADWGKKPVFVQISDNPYRLQ